MIFIQFEYNTLLIKELKNRFPSAKWSKTQKSWYFHDQPAIREILNLPQPEWGIRISEKIHEVNKEAFQQYINQLTLKAYSPRPFKLIFRNLHIF